MLLVSVVLSGVAVVDIPSTGVPPTLVLTPVCAPFELGAGPLSPAIMGVDEEATDPCIDGVGDTEAGPRPLVPNDAPGGARWPAAKSPLAVYGRAILTAVGDALLVGRTAGEPA